MMNTSSELPWSGLDAAICSFEYPVPHSQSAGRFESIPGDEGEEQKHPGEPQKQLQLARIEGERTGELRARKIFEDALRSERDRIAQALHAFEAERQAYFRRVETEVVQLSLTISRKVLHREAQVDKTLLAGLVRVSLGQLTDSTGVVLRVHSSQEAEWNRYFQDADLTPPPQVIGDPSVSASQCVLATQLGSTEIGIDTQLKEIEQGLFDLMSERPGA
jgi:flagellar assembly protein FliH